MPTEVALQCQNGDAAVFATSLQPARLASSHLTQFIERDKLPSMFFDGVFSDTASQSCLLLDEQTLLEQQGNAFAAALKKPPSLTPRHCAGS